MNRNVLILVSAFCLLMACSPEAEEVLQITVAGQIENASGDSVVFEKNGDVHKLAVGEDGTFRGVFVGNPGFYQFNYMREYATCFLNPGDSLLINFDAKQFDESINYTGSIDKANNYLAAKYLLKEEMGKKLGMRDLYSMPEDSFSMELEKSKAELMGLLDSAELPESFAKLEKSNLHYEFMADAKNYEAYHKYFTKKDSFEASEKFKAQFENIDYTNEADFEMIPEYRNVVMSYYSNDKLENCLDKLDSVESSAIKNAVVSRLNDWMSPGTENLEKQVARMQSLASDEELKADIQSNYDKMKTLTKGNESPGFEFKSIRDEMVALNDLKGKNVYIDVWATWCGPCKAEIPHLKELESDYHGKNVEFVSISVDVPKDEQKWRDMVKDKELKGVQLISDNGWDTDFVESYLIMGIPRFILLDAEGKIVSADAPRPSSNEEIRSMIDDLLVKA